VTSTSSRRWGRGGVAALCTALVATPLALGAPATAAAPDHLVISEVYGGGGNTGATFTNDFIELYNPTGADISVDGMSVQYRSKTNTGTGVTTLSGTVSAGGHYLVKEAAGTTVTDKPLPTADATGTLNMSGTDGTVFLAQGTSAITLDSTTNNHVPGVVDLVGYGASNTYETAAAPVLSNTTSASRNATGADTDNNSVDFTAGTPVPQNTADQTPPPPADPVDKTIAEIQGTGATSPEAGHTVVTRGVVTATYPAGGYNGFYIQTEGTGGATDATPGASDAVFVFGSNAMAASPAIGDFVEVTGPVSEYFGTTEITPAAGGVTKLTQAHSAAMPLATAYPTTETSREAHEGELLAPTDTFTVTNTYSTNQYGEIGLATGTKPLIVPTEVADAQDSAAVQAVKDDNAARAVTLDDGASTNFFTGANKDIPLPWLTKTNPVRVGAKATLQAPVVLEYRNNLWKLQPTTQVTDDGSSVATFQNTRTAAPEAVGGNLHLATFNVLNYFNTVGADYTGHACTFYDDRDGNHDTVNDCGPTGPRGAAEADDLKRQQDKIVAAINKLGADVVSLEEIENSVALGEADRDDALRTLVDALNTAAGKNRWAFAPSPAASDLPPTADQDVIRTAFIYDPTTVSLVGASKVLTGSAAFANAREPLAQAFKPKGTPDANAFAVVVNHFKSKGSGTDDGTGQGNANPDRVAQAQDLVPFANDFAASRGTNKVFLTGDFNSYSMEDPIQVLEDAGFKTVNSDDTNEWTYSFGGESGSLDHVLANPAALAMVAGADVWGINSGESVAYEYSRYNYNVTDLYSPDQFRASDHDPEIVGLNADTTPADLHLNLLAVNDFHGRINGNTVKWAGTVEQLTKAATDAGADKTLLVGAGDLIGASEFASSVQKDQPTIDMFNALGLDASAVGNHEFDQGWADLRDRVIGPAGSRNAQWDYLGANVYAKGTHTPVLPEYATYDVGNVKVAVVGAVTQETTSLVSPGGISDLDFGDPVTAVNRVTAELSDGDDSNGEADVIMASFHAGATQGQGSNYAAEVARGGEFAAMANLDPQVDVIFNGHTHQAYAWDAPVPGSPTRTRPIIETGSYGDYVGEINLTINPTTKQVTAYTARNVARTTTADADLVAAYPRVAAVKEIVDDAIAKAAEVGNQPVGSVTSDITTAFAGGSYVGGRYTGGTRDDRLSESTLGDLVANALRDGLPADQGTADIGIVNPGGLRNELRYAGDTTNNPANTDGVVTYAEANSVLPFVNNVWTVDLTGAQLKGVLEQQWQPTGASKPFLALGLSDNVQVTQDASRPAGSRITSVVVDGQPLDPARHYVVSTFSFLGTGGDNFTAFKQGTSKDTGLVDRDLWIQYLKDHAGIAPDFARQQVAESGLPSSVGAGDQVSFSLSKLNLTSLGSPENTTVDVSLRTPDDTRKVGDFPVTDGTANVSFTAPATIPAGSTFVVTAHPGGTTVVIPATATADPAVDTTTTAKVTPSRVVVRATRPTVHATVKTAGGAPAGGGTVTVSENGRSLGTATVADGTAAVRLPVFATTGTHTLTVAYTGVTGSTRDSSTTVRVGVVKADPTTKVSVGPRTVHRGTTRPRLTITLTAPGQTVAGYVAVRAHGQRVALARLVHGKATVSLPRYRSTGVKAVVVRYLGWSLAESTRTTSRFRVVR
jgi:predicted extracellular nuclease/2',3'-cyclic-nucleotide 2'-phosphodiesterase (5'-nucleotidase family)